MNTGFGAAPQSFFNFVFTLAVSLVSPLAIVACAFPRCLLRFHFYFYDSTRATCNNTPHTGRQADLVRSSVAILVCGKDNHTSAENRRASLSKRASLPACTGWVREGEERQGLLCVTRLRINITRFLYIPHASLVSCLFICGGRYSHPLPHTHKTVLFSFPFQRFAN